MKKETLVSIAERSGCSISTVSRVLSGNAAKYRISQRTVARVTEEVKRCNYTPSLLAKGLRTNRTDTIGLLIPNIENSFFAGVAGVVIRESRNYNYKVVVVDTQEDERNEQDGTVGAAGAAGGRHRRRAVRQQFGAVRQCAGGRHAAGADRPLSARRRDALLCHDGQLPRCGDGDRVPARKRTPPHRLHPGHAPFDACAGPRAGIRRHAAGARPRGPDRGDGRGFLGAERLSGDQAGAGPGGAAHGDLRLEQPNSARGGEGGARVGPADSRRHFGRFVRRQHAFQLPRSGDHLHRPADGRDRTLAVKLLIRAVREPARRLRTCTCRRR